MGSGYNDRMSYDENKEFKKVLKSAKLTEKQYNFFKNLVNPESETCGNIERSYIKAGYGENPTAKYNAYKLHNSPKFQKVLTAYREKELEKRENREMSVRERTYADLDFIIDQSRARCDLGTMRQAVMDRAKIAGLQVERHQIIDPATELDIDKSMKLEAARLAEQRLLNAPNAPIDVNRLSESSSKEVESRIIDEKEGFEPLE